MSFSEKHFHGSDMEEISKVFNISKDSIINFASNVNPYGCSNKLKEHLINDINAIEHYPDRDYTLLRAAIAKYCNAVPENIVVGNGCSELINAFIQIISPESATIVSPTYSEYSHAVSIAGGKSNYFEMSENEDFRLNVEELMDSFSKDTNLLIICNPNNPTSKLINLSDIERIVKFCFSKNINVIIDETYIEFVSDPLSASAASLTNKYNNLSVLRGTSKFFCCPGLRLGYAITGNDILKNSLKNTMSPWTVSSLAESAGQFMFSDNNYISEISIKMNNERMRMYDFFNDSKIFKAYKPQANFILLKILDSNLSSAEIFEKAIKSGLMIRDCSDFIGLSNRFIRFCFLNPDEDDKLITLLQSLN